MVTSDFSPVQQADAAGAPTAMAAAAVVTPAAFRKHLISRRNFLKAAGVTTAAAAMAVGAPAASACWTGEKSEVTILYTNDVHYLQLNNRRPAAAHEQ